jgi:hypothetical protein
MLTGREAIISNRVLYRVSLNRILRGQRLRIVREFVALAALLALWAVTVYALLGPNPLPGRIPTHFDLAGNPDGWGKPEALWLLPIVGTFLYSLMTVVARFPAHFNYPVVITSANRATLQHLGLGMVGWLKAEVIFLFAGIQVSTIQAARQSRGGPYPMLFAIALVVVFGTIGWHIMAMRRTVRLNLPR